MVSRVTKAVVQAFDVGARPFTPGKMWMKPKKVHWHTQGITKARYFNINEDLTGEGCVFEKPRILKGKPASTIKLSDPDAAIPFKIPEDPDADPPSPPCSPMSSPPKKQRPKLVRTSPPHYYNLPQVKCQRSKIKCKRPKITNQIKIRILQEIASIIQEEMNEKKLMRLNYCDN